MNRKSFALEPLRGTRNLEVSHAVGPLDHPQQAVLRTKSLGIGRWGLTQPLVPGTTLMDAASKAKRSLGCCGSRDYESRSTADDLIEVKYPKLVVALNWA